MTQRNGHDRHDRHDRLLTPDEAAAMLGVQAQTLAVWRSNKRYSLPFVKVGSYVRYRESDIEDWLDERTVRHTTD